jgi:hypothetical protein
VRLYCWGERPAGAVLVFSGDVLGSHDMGPGGPSPVKGGLPPCQYCHAPHSGIGKGPLWAQTYSSQTYTLYRSTTTQRRRWNSRQSARPAACA